VRTERQRRMRYETLSTTIKLAKFLQASAVYPHISKRNEAVVQRIRRRIVREGNVGGGRWRCIMDHFAEAPSVCATAEASIALSMLEKARNSNPASNKLVLSGISALSEIAGITAPRVAKPATWSDRLVALWGLSELAPVLSGENRMIATKALMRMLPHAFQNQEFTVGDRFHNDTSGVQRNDYYLFNTRLLATVAAINYSILQSDFTVPAALLATVDDAASQIINTGVYRRPNGDGILLFWEHYQAMDTIYRFAAA
jgi:hypothetical protein